MDFPRALRQGKRRLLLGTIPLVDPDLTSHNVHSDSQSDTRKLSLLTPPAPLPSLSNLNLEHLELMHHYSIHTSHTFGEGRWDTLIPAQAQSYEFLMHALLGVSALHIVYLRGRDGDPSTTQYLSRARAHHAEALTLFRSAITDIRPVNGTATAAFSCLFMIFSCGTAQLSSTERHRHHQQIQDQTQSQDQDQDPIDALVAIMRYFRSSCNLLIVASSSVSALESQPCPSLILRHPYNAENPTAMIALNDLLDTNATSSSPDAHKVIYHDTILQMQRSLDSGHTLPKIAWPLSVSDEYLALLEQKEYMALVILAHGCNLTRALLSRWYIHDWIPRTTRAISELVGEGWSVSMRWPMVQSGILLGEGEDEMVGLREGGEV